MPLAMTRRRRSRSSLSLQDVAALLRTLPRQRAPQRLRRKLLLIPRNELVGP